MSTDPREESGVAVAKKPKLQAPKRYKVLLHNDDYTTMEFVVHVLQRCFEKTRPEAQALMLEVHSQGCAICGIYTHEIAESKTAQVIKYARENGHPLKCTYEPCEDES
jgi:ATP-dependent Clp protease adaptor protein ClpS